MARKRNEVWSLPSEGNPMPLAHRRPARSKAAAAGEVKSEAPEETAADAVAQSAPASQPVSEREEIAKLAYSYWEERGHTGGSAEEDWLRAEEEYRRRTAALE